MSSKSSEMPKSATRALHLILFRFSTIPAVYGRRKKISKTHKGKEAPQTQSHRSCGELTEKSFPTASAPSGPNRPAYAGCDLRFTGEDP